MTVTEIRQPEREVPLKGWRRAGVKTVPGAERVAVVSSQAPDGFAVGRLRKALEPRRVTVVGEKSRGGLPRNAVVFDTPRTSRAVRDLVKRGVLKDW